MVLGHLVGVMFAGGIGRRWDGKCGRGGEVFESRRRASREEEEERRGEQRRSGEAGSRGGVAARGAEEGHGFGRGPDVGLDLRRGGAGEQRTCRWCQLRTSCKAAPTKAAAAPADALLRTPLQTSMTRALWWERHLRPRQLAFAKPEMFSTNREDASSFRGYRRMDNRTENRLELVFCHFSHFWTVGNGMENSLEMLLESKILLVCKYVIHFLGAPVNLENNSFHLTESTPPMDATFLAWNYIGNRDAERLVFRYLAATSHAAATKADLLLCNTFADLEPAIFTEPRPAATILPIGPLRTWQRPTRHAPVGHFWHADDDACLSFLDAQPRGSVVYVAFGSITTMTAAQVQELALGLEASGRPFLWVVRPGLVEKLPSGFTDSVAGQGNCKVVRWAPQEQVLAHPAVGCFMTHCGWNSTLEGVRNGLPMLCWPYFTDQFTNQTYICDIWRVGLRVAPADGGGMVTKESIAERLDELLEDEGVKERVQKLKELAEKSMSEEGESLKNLNVLIESMWK